MGTSHPLSVTTNNHAITGSVPYADIAARDAATSFHSVATNVNKVVRVNSPLSFYILTSITPTWIEITNIENDTFIEHADTPGTFSGQGGLVLQVNSGATAVEFGQNLNTTAGPTFATMLVNGSASSVSLTLSSTTGAFLPNRLTTTQRDALTPSAGMTIFNTSTTSGEIYNGTTWITMVATGDVTKVGTPVDNQVGVWTGDGTIEGTAGLTFDGSSLLVTGSLRATGTLLDSSGDAGTSGQVLSSTLTGTNWVDPTGDVSKVGTPVDNQMAVWTGDGTIDGATNMISDGSKLTIGTSTLQSPSLHVAGTGTLDTGQIIADFNNSANSSRIVLRDRNNTGPLPPLVSSTSGGGLGLAAESGSGSVVFYAGGILAANERMRVSNTIVNALVNLQIDTTAPALTFVDTDATADNAKWDVITSDERFQIRSLNDAVTSAGIVMLVERTGTTIDLTNFPGVATAINKLAVGTGTAKAESLHVVGTGTTGTGQAIAAFNDSADSARLLFRDETSVGGIPPMLSSSSGGGLSLGAESGAAPIKFYTGGILAVNERMIITNSGVTLAGDLTVNGATTTLNTAALLVEDKNVTIGNVTTPTDVTADGGGITLKGATDKTLNWVNATNSWTFNQQVEVSTSVADTAAVITTQSTGTNPGTTSKHVGNRDPQDNVTAAGGAEYYRDSGATSGTYESLEATTGTNWFKRSLRPATDIEINTSAQLEALASGGVITIAVPTNIHIRANITTSSRFSVNVGIILVITTGSEPFSLTYSGTGDFFSGAGTVRVRAADILSSSTGTLVNISGGGSFGIENTFLAGWNTLGSVSGGTTFLLRFSTFISVTTGFTLTDMSSAQVLSVRHAGAGIATPFFTWINKKAEANISLRSVPMAMTSAGSVIDVSTNLNDLAPVTVEDISFSAGNLFKQTAVSEVAITAVADASIANGTITAMADNSDGGTTITCSSTYFDGEVIVISGTTSYNGTFRIFNVVASISFDIQTAFVANDATGTTVSERIDLTVAVSHGIVATDSLKVKDTNFHNGFNTVLIAGATLITINGNFISTNTGNIQRDVGLDQTDPRVRGNFNPGVIDSHFIGCAHVNDNSTANGAIVNNTFTDMVFGTVGAALLASSTMERFRLTDELNGTFEYIGIEPFDGLITFDFTVDATAEQDFRFKWEIDTGSGFGDLPDPVEALASIKDTATSVTKTFPLAANKGDKIKPQITRNAGSAGITTVYATIYATG